MKSAIPYLAVTAALRSVLAGLIALLASTSPVTAQDQSANYGHWVDSFRPVFWGPVRNKQVIDTPWGIIAYNDNEHFLRLDAGGAPDPNFIPSGRLQPILVQPDGKIIARQYILFGQGFSVVRLNIDGTHDLTFQASETHGRPEDLPVCGVYLPNGRAIVGNGHRLVMLNQNGTASTFFDANTVFLGPFGGGVRCIARQSDGKLLVGIQGRHLLAEDMSYHLIRLNEDGSRDLGFGFDGSLQGDNSFEEIICQPDDKILVAGQFTNLVFTPRSGIARLTTDGMVDPTFYPSLSCLQTKIFAGTYKANGDENWTAYHPPAYVLRMALQTDGRLALFGAFDKIGFTEVSNLMWVFTDSAHTQYNQYGDFFGRYTIGYPAGAEYLRGHKEYIPSTDIVNKVWPDGAAWRWFDAGLAVLNEGGLVVGGEFDQSSGFGELFKTVAKFTNLPVTNSITSADGVSAQWNRAGAGPEIYGARFELSLDGGNSWTVLGAGSRIGTTSNWQIGSLSLPPTGKLRARGVTNRGGLIETTSDFDWARPIITSFTPSSGPSSTSVVITGVQFGSAYTVTFNGRGAAFVVNSSTQITATVPFGDTTGPLTVTTPFGTATSANSFTRNHSAPTLTSFTPTGGSSGSLITITGTELDSTTAVSINGTSAEFFLGSNTQMQVIVPAGATSGPISVTTLGGTVTSAGNFALSSLASGTWSTKAWTGDSTTGIPATDSAANGYLQGVMHFGSGTAANVNGQNVNGFSGINGYVWGAYFELGAPAQFPVTTNNLTAQGGPGSAVMASSFWYGDDRQSVLFNNLTPGQDYRASFFSVGFEEAGTRLVNFRSGTDQLVVDQSQFGMGNGIRVDYHFTASTPSQTVNLDAINTDIGRTWHLYAISLVRVVPQKPTLTTLAATSVTANSAVLNGTVTANGSPTTARFYYGSPNWQSNTLPSPVSPATGWNGTAFSATLTGLKGHTQYEYIAFGSNAVGAYYGESATQFFTPNTVPLADHTSASTTEDTAVFFPLPVSDADGDDLTVTLVSLPAGTVAIFPFAPYVDYTPAPNYVGPDSFSYRVTDGFGGTSVTRAVNITVTAVNDPPTLSSIPDATINEDAGTQTVSLAGISSGAANESQALTLTAISNNPALIPNPAVTYSSPSSTGSLSYTPVAEASGTAVITVTVSEGGEVISQSFTVTVNSVNDAPSFALPSSGTSAGEVWTAQASGNRHWSSIASSFDGKKLAAVGGSGQIYTSMNSGVTWTEQASGSRNWRSIASSFDGTKLAAVAYQGQIYTSTDSGVTWTVRESSRNWRSIASSADGTKLAAIVYDGQIYTSTDSGVSWTARESSRSWSSIASSADGTKLAATVGDGQIHTSTDSGVTWTARESSRSWVSIASSGDGTKLAAVVSSGQIYTSTNSGVTWTAQASGNRLWNGIASSADGTKLAAVVSINQIYTSTDSGVTWAVRASGSGYWSCIAASGDGTTLAAAIDVGQIYTSTVPLFGPTVASDSGANSVIEFATTISPGPADEMVQTVGFNVSNTNNALFTVQPAIASNGTLTFTPSGTAVGTATLTVTAQDNGGVANGGVNTSGQQFFTITITLGVNDAPSFALPATQTPAGEVWTARGYHSNWGSIASSADGTKLAGVEAGGRIYTSTDSGATWTVRTTENRSWESIASSSDGTKLAAAVSSGQIYTSSDSGLTWTARESSRSWRSIASSADGTKLAAVTAYAQIYTSSDSGLTWTGRENSRNWSSIASSSDGTKLAAVVLGGQIYTSTNSGATWTGRENSRYWRSIASSSDGTKLAAVVAGGQIYTSTDSGVTWTAQASGSPDWRSITSSSDGSKLAAVVFGGPVYSSTDSGVTWTARADYYNWTSITSSSDGTKLAAVGGSGQVHTSVGLPYLLSVAANSGANTTASFATNISPGPANEAAQTVSFSLSNTNNALFTVQPAISANGTLTFTASGTVGTATVTVTAQDNGGGAFGGVDTSAPQTFTIAVENFVNTAPGFTLPTSGIPAGEAWTARESSRSWTSIASSADGMKLAAVCQDQQIYTSTDAGVTWTAQASGSLTWSSVASSADGTKLAAVVGSGQIYTSTNSGVTWTQQGGISDWASIASSADGTKLAAVTYTGKIHTSADSGVTWKARESSRTWRSIASSSDGQKLAAVVGGSGGLIYTSSDSGLTWTAQDSGIRQWSSIASSADGTKLAAVGWAQIYTSSDSGVTWTARESTRTWRSITSSADGTKLAAVVNEGQIYTSTDAGVTWTAQPSGNRSWRGIASSADGTKLAAVPLYGNIYTSTAAPYVLSVAATSGTNTVPAFATNISPGPANDAAQTVSFNLSNTNNTLFTTQPALASNGTLTFTLDPSASGTATVTVTAQDNGGVAFGGVAFGGVDTSAPQTFTITVTTSAPLVTTPTVTNITATGATLGGDVAGTGGSAVTARGVVYSLTAVNANPTLATGTVVTVIGTTGVFPAATGTLTPNSGYTFKAYATNALGTSYTSAATFTTLGLPEIAVTGNGASITDGDVTPDLADFSDFSSAVVVGGTVQRTFTISNSGLGALTLGTVTMSGPNAAEFSITAQPLSPVAASGTTTFQVTFDPSATGLRTATLSFANDDPDENPFNFSIQGTGYDSAGAADTANYAASYGLTGANAAPTAEPFNDGVSNLLKYAFNMPLTGPNVSGLAPGTGNSGLPSITIPDTGGPPDSIRVEFIRRRNSGLIYTPQYSTNDLGNFIAMTAAEAVTTIDANWERVVVNQPLGLPLPMTTFSRVSVTAP